MEEIKCQKTKKKLKKSEHKFSFPAKWRKCTYDLIAFRQRDMKMQSKSPNTCYKISL